MSYCVNCGVELKPSEPRCPLCGVEVVNPAEPFCESAARPYPRHVEHINARIDRRYAAEFISLLLLIPLFITLFTNLLVSHALTWSLYVVGALALVFVTVLLPMLFLRRRPTLFILLDGAALALFLFSVEQLAGAQFFTHLGLPLCALVTLFTLAVNAAFSEKWKTDPLIRTAALLALLGFLTVGIELSIMLYADRLYIPQWSMYALFPCLVLAGCLLLLNRKKKVKDELKKRFFV